MACEPSVLVVYYLLENIITAHLKGGRQQSRGEDPPLENTLASQEEQNGANFSFVAPSSEELLAWREI